MDHEISTRMDAALHSAACALAQARDITLGQLVRDALAQEIAQAQRKAKTPNRADEQLVARLQRLLAPAMAEARSWPELARVLARLGYELRPAGGGLTLHLARTGARLCKSSELGFAYSRLVRRFQAPMPGHPHQMRHLLADRPAEPAQEDFCVIERF